VETSLQRTLGRYQIEAEIGRGAMGVVFRALDPKIDRPVAIKTISLSDQDPEYEHEYRERFAREVRAAGRLSHPGIVTIFDAGEDPETHEPFFAMEYVPGQTLSEFAARAGGKLDVGTALRFASEIAEALDYAHSHGVIHGDIKPANILITQDGHAKIADFGVAHLHQTVASQSGLLFGSPAYMAPEQLSGGRADARSDLFSLGVVLYGMLTGFRPFQGNSARTVCFKVMNVEPIPVTAFRAELAPELDRIVRRGMAKEPAQRYQTGAEMVRDLYNFAQTDTSLADATSFLTRVLQQSMHDAPSANPFFDRRFLLQAGAAVLAIAVAATAWQVHNDFSASDAILPPSPFVPKAPPVEHTHFHLPPIIKRIFIRAQPSEQQPESPQSQLQVEILHHFDSATASLWLDDKLVMTQDLRGDIQHHNLFRSVAINQVTTLSLPPGKHKLEIRITSAPSHYDQFESMEADLSTGLDHVLHINCTRRKLQVDLQ
jgi:serine/threonine protein kinase